MTTTNYNIRLDQELKENAFSVFESYGLTPSQAIKLFLTQVAQTNTVPLSFDYQKPSNQINQYKNNCTDISTAMVYNISHTNKYDQTRSNRYGCCELH